VLLWEHSESSVKPDAIPNFAEEKRTVNGGGGGRLL
jgi:hypothetical protein